MIRITIHNTGIFYDVDIRGHAKYAELEKDIVCAGVSVITYTLANYIISSNNVCHKEVQEFEKKGNFHMKCILGDESGRGVEIAREVLTAIEKGYHLMEKEYPEYVKIETW